MIPPSIDYAASNAMLPRRVVNTCAAVSWGGKLILATLILTFLEGALRKWVFHGSPYLRYGAYFSKDAVFVLAGLAGLMSMTITQRTYANLVLFVSVLFIVPPSLAHLTNVSLVGTILSLRAYILLPWCAFLAAGTIRSIKDIDRIVIVIGVLAIAAALLGLVQYQLPPGHVLNRYDMDSKEITGRFGRVRATGPFSYITGMSVMAAAAAWAGTYLFLSGTDIVRRGFAVIIAAAGIVCALVSMSRHGLLIALLIILGGAACFRRGQELIYVGILAALGYWVFVIGIGEETIEAGTFGATVRRFEESDSFGNRLNYILEDFNRGLTEYPFGTGLGTGQVGAFVAGLDNSAGKFRAIESEQGRILLEIGVPGLLGVVIIRLSVLWAIGLEMIRCTERRMLALYAASLPMLVLAFLNATIFNHTNSSVTWCVVALVFGCMKPTVPTTEHRTREAQVGWSR